MDPVILGGLSVLALLLMAAVRVPHRERFPFWPWFVALAFGAAIDRGGCG